MKGNILDLVLKDRPNKIISVNTAVRLGRSDHEKLLVDLEVGPQKKKPLQMARNWQKANRDAMREELGAKDWTTKLHPLGTEDAWNTLKSTIETLNRETCTQAHAPHG